MMTVEQPVGFSSFMSSHFYVAKIHTGIPLLVDRKKNPFSYRLFSRRKRSNLSSSDWLLRILIYLPSDRPFLRNSNVNNLFQHLEVSFALRRSDFFYFLADERMHQQKNPERKKDCCARTCKKYISVNKCLILHFSEHADRDCFIVD